MKKKFIAHVTALTLLFTTAFCGISAPVHAAEPDNTELPEVIEVEHEFYKDPETGHIGVIEDESSVYSRPDNSGVAPNKAIPSSYGGFNNIKATYPCTRDQNPYGTCWAHAATACAEFDLVKNHGFSKEKADFSELQLAYFNYNDPFKLSGLEEDNVWIPSSADSDYLDMGGNILFSMHTLAQWKGYTYESNLPYSTVRNNRYAPVSKYAAAYHDAAQLRNVRYLDIKSNPNSVKQAIMDYGAVYISYFHDSRYYSLNKYSLYYNPDKNAGTNHDVVIVGWDDSIPASVWPAGNRPSRNGAWLVRNSWSTNQNVGSEYTYFYMSYDDATLDSTAFSLDFEPGSQNDTLYQHDGSTTHSFVYTNSVANVFTANLNDGYTAQRLDSVMIPFTSDTNVNYKIEVYTGLTSSKPKSGHLNSSATTTGWTNARGIYTIDLKSPVYLNPGEKFSIVVTSLNGSTNFEIESSSNITYYNEVGNSVPWFSTTASAASGESFIYNGSSYVDAVNYNDPYSLLSLKTGNICVKAIAANTYDKKYKITYNLNGGTNSSANPDGFLSTKSGSFTLKNPTRSGYHFVGWYTDKACTNKVTAINYNNKTDKTLYAKWCSNDNSTKTSGLKRATMKENGSYKKICSGCSKVMGTYTVYKPTSIKLSAAKLLYTGKNRSPYPVIENSNSKTLKNGTDYTYKYNTTSRKNTGRYSVTITFKGKYDIPNKKLYFTIVPDAPSTASAKLYGYDDIKVSWSKCTGASGYYVYYKKSSDSSYSKYKRVTGTYAKFADLTDNVKYNFKVIPYKKIGDTRYKSTKSKIVSATTLKKMAQPTITRVSGGRLSLDWKSISGASGYQVYWSTSKSGTYKKLCDYSNKYIGVTFSVGSGKTYWYKVRAYKTVNKTKIFGPFSTPKSFKR